MTSRTRAATAAALAALTLGMTLTSTAAQAGDYGRPTASYDRLGSADPCRREAGNRALTWGVIGLLAGATAGGAAAGAGVVAEGAGLGGLVGGVIGAKAGAASAACGTARDPYAYWNHPSYRAANGEDPSPYYANPDVAELPPVDDRYYRDNGGYQYQSSYDSRYDDSRYAPRPCDCDDRRYGEYDRGYGDYDRSASSYSRSSSGYDTYDYNRSVSEESYGSLYQDTVPARRYEERRSH